MQVIKDHASNTNWAQMYGIGKADLELGCGVFGLGLH